MGADPALRVLGHNLPSHSSSSLGLPLGSHLQDQVPQSLSTFTKGGFPSPAPLNG